MRSGSQQIGTRSVSSKNKVAITTPTKDSSKVITNVQTARPTTTTMQLRTIGALVRQNMNSIIILIVGISILIFACVMVTILIISITSRSKEEEQPDVIPDPCVDEYRNCYKPDCDDPYVAAKQTSVDDEPCVPVRPPYLRDFNGKICTKGGGFMIPWCYVTSQPPFRRQPCYKFCDQPNDCLDRQRACYHANKADCGGHNYAYTEVYGGYASLGLNMVTPCSSRHNNEPFCVLTNTIAPWCYNDSGFKQFCYPSCRAVEYLQSTDRLYGAMWVYRNYSGIFLDGRNSRSLISKFKGTNPEDCFTLCNRTQNCYYYSSTGDGEGKCNLFTTASFNRVYHQSASYGWIGRNDTVVLYGGKICSKGGKWVSFPQKINTLRIHEDRTVWWSFKEDSPIREQLNPITTSRKGLFYATNWRNNDYDWKYIEEYNERGLMIYVFQYLEPPILYGAILGINDLLFMCGGLTADPEIQEDAVCDCAIYDTTKRRFDNREYYYDRLSGVFWGVPAKMLLPRVNHFLVHYEGFIFAFMGCQKRIENCKEMVKPIHYFSIKDNKWRKSGISMQIERIYYGHAVYKDSVYVCGGATLNRSEILDDCEVYHLATPLKQNGTTTRICSLPSRTRDLVMAVIGDMMLAIGGRHSNDEKNVSNAILRYSDSSGGFTLFEKMAQRRYGMGVAVI